MLILAILCAVFFAAAIDLAIKNKDLSNDLMKLSDKVAQKEIDLIRAQGLISETRYKIVTLERNRLITPEFLQAYGEEAALEEAKKYREIIDVLIKYRLCMFDSGKTLTIYDEKSGKELLKGGQNDWINNNRDNLCISNNRLLNGNRRFNNQVAFH